MRETPRGVYVKLKISIIMSIYNDPTGAIIFIAIEFITVAVAYIKTRA